MDEDGFEEAINFFKQELERDLGRECTYEEVATYIDEMQLTAQQEAFYAYRNRTILPDPLP